MTLHRVCSAVYRAALTLYPRAVRDRFGGDMRQTFDARLRRTTGVAALTLLAAELADLARSSLSAPSGRKPVSREAPMHALSPSAVLQDLRYAARLLARQPAFTLVAVLTLALGVGANTAVFTIVNGVLIRPLPYRDPDHLLLLLNGRGNRMGPVFSPLNYRDLTRRSGVFSEAAAFNPSTVNLTGGGEPQHLQGADVTWSFFDVLGAAPGVGRGFVDSDAREDAKVVVISDGLWRQRFARRPDALGAQIALDGVPYTIVGIAPDALDFPGHADYWRPLTFTPHNLEETQRGAQWVSGIARLRPGLTLRQANGALAIMAGQLATEFPRVNQGRLMAATPLRDRMVQTIRPALLLLLGAVALVLLIACVNVANLLLARASARTREVAVRAAVGAGRARLVRQFLAESLLLGLVGGAAGLIVAIGATRALVALGPASIPRLSEVAVDLRVLAFTLAVAIATSVLFGLVPALTATGAGHAASAPRGAAAAGGTRARKILVAGEMALAVMLLIAAGLLVRSYARLSNVDPGFSPDHLLTFSVSLPAEKYQDLSAISRFVSAYMGRLGGEPGVVAAAAAYGLPLQGEFNAWTSFTRPGQIDTADSPSLGMRVVTPDYFRAMRIPLIAGRPFDAHDDEGGSEVVMINQEAARRYWPGETPIGQHLHLGASLMHGVRSGQKTIVGIVGDVKYGGLDANAPPEVYLPEAQHPVDQMTITVRTAGDPLAVAPVARADLAALDRELPMADVLTMDALVGRSIAERRFTMLLLAAFAGVALALAIIGVYGVLAYVVSQRTQEIGVRLAIGASPRDVVGLFVREGVELAGIGLACGVVGALVGARALSTMLFGVTATDPVTFLGVVVCLGVVAFAASYLPARRAAAVDPMNALRAE